MTDADPGSTLVVGVDGGGTGCTAVVLDDLGRERGRGHGGAANYHSAGTAMARQSMADAVGNAVDSAGCEVTDLDAATLAVSGVDVPADREQVRRMTTHFLPKIPVDIFNDTRSMLASGLVELRDGERPRLARKGVVVIAGTGSNCVGVNESGEEKRAGGWGYWVEDGSGSAIARQTLRAMTEAIDGYGPDTSLVDRITGELELDAPSDIIVWVYAGDREVSEIAGLARLTSEEASAGDAVARGILETEAEALSRSIEYVARTLGLTEQSFRFVMGGGMLRKSPVYRELLTAAVKARVPAADPRLADLPPAVAAAVLALDRLGLTESA